MARKRFGQNFLIDQSVIYAIINAIDPQPGQHIVEIGPGYAALTKQLITSKAKIDAIEIDRDLIAYLQKLDAPNLTVHNADILDFDLRSLKKPPLRLIGNLPYNISTPLLFKLFVDIDIITDMYFMLQREVAERLVSAPNCKTYGKLSVMAQYYCNMEILFDVPPQAFDPAPKVYSSVIKFVPNTAMPSIDTHLMHNIASAAFNHRRKTIANSLHPLLTQQDLLHLGINPQLRAENLTVMDYITLTNYLSEKGT